MIESNNGTANEPEIDPRAFRLFVSWLYRGEVAKDIGTVTEEAAENAEVRILFYAAADKFMLDENVRKEILEQVLAEAVNPTSAALPGSNIQPKAVHLVFDVLSEDDPLRTAVLDIACRDLLERNDEEWLKDVLAGLDAEAVQTFFRAYNSNMRLQSREISLGPDWVSTGRNCAVQALESLMRSGSQGDDTESRYKTGFLRQGRGSENAPVRGRVWLRGRGPRGDGSRGGGSSARGGPRGGGPRGGGSSYLGGRGYSSL